MQVAGRLGKQPVGSGAYPERNQWERDHALDRVRTIGHVAVSERIHDQGDHAHRGSRGRCDEQPSQGSVELSPRGAAMMQGFRLEE